MLNSDVSDHSTVVLKRFGPKRVLCDCSRYHAMAKPLSTMLMLFQKSDRIHPLSTLRIQKFFTGDSTSASGEDVLDDTIPPIQRDENTSNEQRIDICNIASHSKESKLSAKQKFQIYTNRNAFPSNFHFPG